MNSYQIIINVAIILLLVADIADSIFGGFSADKTKKIIPYQVSIKVEGNHIGGGCIIHKYFVLTVAQVVINRRKQFANVQFVVFTANKLHDSGNPVNKLYVSRKYNFQPMGENFDIVHSDLTLLKTEEAFEFSNTLQPAKLPTNNDIKQLYGKKVATVSGYGRNKVFKLGGLFCNKLNEFVKICSACNELRYAETDFFAHTMCSKQYKGTVSTDHICGIIKANNGVAGNCLGDLGNPLVLEDKNIVIGILTSRSKNCNEKEQASLYVNVASNLEYINSIINNTVDTNLTRVAYYEESSQGCFGPSRKYSVKEHGVPIGPCISLVEN